MDVKTYSWKTGVQFNVTAKVAAETIADLQRKLGKEDVTAKELLNASRAENAPLHDCFEWDDSIAAEKFRTDQARRIIGGINITIQKVDSPPVVTRAFVNINNVAPKKEGSFVSTEYAMEKPDLRNLVLRNALRELRAFQAKYDVYQELTSVFKAINAFGDSLK